MTYDPSMSPDDKPLVWLQGEIKSPPFSSVARLEAGFLLRRLQRGDKISMPHSRPMPPIGRRCHELRIQDVDTTWRLVYRVDDDAVLILHIFAKKTPSTPKAVLDTCKLRLRGYDEATR